MATSTATPEVVETKKTRNRPNKTQILATIQVRGKMTCNEKTTLQGVEVKNILQRVYNKTMTNSLSKAECDKLQKAMKTFLAEVNEVIPKGK